MSTGSESRAGLRIVFLCVAIQGRTGLRSLIVFCNQGRAGLRSLIMFCNAGSRWSA